MVLLALGKYGFSSELFASHPHYTPVYLFNTLLEQVWQLGGANLATLLNILGLMAAFYFLLKLAYPLGKLNARVLALLLSLGLLSRSIEIGPSTLMFCLFLISIFDQTGQKSKKADHYLTDFAADLGKYACELYSWPNFSPCFVGGRSLPAKASLTPLKLGPYPSLTAYFGH